eukprot:3377887-Ditylum_brightwellii.AAC.1
MEMYALKSAFARAIIDDATGRALEFRDLIICKKYRTVCIILFMKELDQLAQGKCSYKDKDTVFSIQNIVISQEISHGPMEQNS